MRQKKEKGNIQKSSPGAAKTANPSKNSERRTKKSTPKMVKATRHLKLPRLSNQVSKLVKTIKKRTDISRTTRVIKKPAFTLQKRRTRTVQKRSTELVKMVENVRQQRLLHQKNQLKGKKKQSEINTKKNLKQTRLLLKKDSPKRMSSNVKTKAKIVRNSKKSTLVSFTSEIVENRLPQDVITTNRPPTAIITVTNKESRYVSQSTQTPITVCEILKTGNDEIIRRELPLGTITVNISSQISRTGKDENRRQLPITTNISSNIARTANYKNRRQLPIKANISSQVFKTVNKKNRKQFPPGTIIHNNSLQISKIVNKENKRQLPTRSIVSNNSLHISRNGNDENRRQLAAGTGISNTSHLDPDMRIITPSTAVAPAVTRDRPSSSNIRFLTGFDRNLEPSEIIHIAEINKERYFMIKWKGTSKMDLVPAKIAKERCPQLVIRFYESRLKNVFHSSVR